MISKYCYLNIATIYVHQEDSDQNFLVVNIRNFRQSTTTKYLTVEHLDRVNILKHAIVLLSVLVFTYLLIGIGR